MKPVERIDIAMSGPTSNDIENEEKTPLEKQEFIATNLPLKQDRVIEATRRIIAQEEKSIQDYEHLIRISPQAKDREKYESYKAKHTEFKKKQEAFLQLLLAQAPVVDEIAAQAGREVESEK